MRKIFAKSMNKKKQIAVICIYCCKNKIHINWLKHLTFLLNHHCTKIYTLFSRFEFFFLLAINKFIFQSLACVSVNKSTFISSARMVYPLLLICNSCLIARERVNRRISENTEKKAPATVECAPSCLFVPIYHQFSSDNLQDLLFALFFLIQMNHNNMNSSTPNQSPWIIWLFRFFFYFLIANNVPSP